MYIPEKNVRIPSGVPSKNENDEKELVDGPDDSGLRKKMYPSSIMPMAAIIKITDTRFANFGRSVSDILFPPLLPNREINLPN